MTLRMTGNLDTKFTLAVQLAFCEVSPWRNSRHAHLKVPALTRLLRPLTFRFTTKNGHSCLWQNGWKGVRHTRSRLLAERSGGALERLEMAAEKSGYFARPTRAAPEIIE